MVRRRRFGYCRRLLAGNLLRKLRERYPHMATDNARIFQLEKDSPLSASTIKRILKESHSPTVDRLEELAYGLKCEPYELFLDTNEEQQS